MKRTDERTTVPIREALDEPSSLDLWLIFLESAGVEVMLPRVSEQTVMVPGPEEQQ